MAKLGRFSKTVLDTTGAPISSASVTIYREGATVNGNQSGTSPLTVTVFDNGRIAAADSVFVNTTTGTTYTVDSTTDTTVVISGFVGTLALTSGDRLIPSNSLPTLYSDDWAGATTANPLTTSATGYASCWMDNGIYDFIVSGGGATTTLFRSHQVIGGDIIEYNVKAYGAKGDNSTDDATAINAAINDAQDTVNGGTGGIVYFPKGIYKVGAQIVVKNKVRLVGAGARASVIKANAGVAPATGLVRIGDGTSTVFNSRIEHMYIDCNDVAASIGVYSTEAQEQCGVFNCVVNGYRSLGIDFESGIGAVTEINNVELFGSGSSAPTSAIKLNGSGAITKISHVTVNGAVGFSHTQAIHVVSQQALIEGFHCEQATHGVTFDTTATGSVIGMSGHSSVTNCVNIVAGNGGGVTAIDVNVNGATNAILDSLTSRTMAGSINFYQVSQSGAAGVGKQVIHSNAGVAWNVRSPDGSTVQANTDLDTTPDVSAGRVFAITNSGATTITAFDGGTAGQTIRLIFRDANTTLTDGGTLKLSAAFTSSGDDTMVLLYDGSNWYELSRSVN